MKKRILIIDDDHGTMDLYSKALRLSGFDVTHLDTTKAALEHISSYEPPFDLYVLDLMMPPGDVLKLEESGFGLSTGFIIYQKLRIKSKEVPVIILTSVSNPDILGLLPVDSNTDVRAKIDLMPFELAQLITQTLGNE